MNREKQKIGRNEPCPCGSGRKYKRCHGNPNREKVKVGQEFPDPGYIELLRKRAQAREVERQKIQGLGRPIVSETFQGNRLVAVGNTVYFASSWNTFHDFLLDYLDRKFGRDWICHQEKLSEEDQSPLILWKRHVRSLQERHATEDRIKSAPMTGAAQALLDLAYNLYLLQHNEKVERSLISRMKDNNNFRGAVYETYVAGYFIKSGFSLDLENEADGRKTHCEFSAAHGQTGRKFSVEAKARAPGKTHSNVNSQLCKALRKKADHARIIFIDVNMFDDGKREGRPEYMDGALQSIRKVENSDNVKKPFPSAYVYVTNHPFEYSLDTTDFRRTMFMEGFKDERFKQDKVWGSLIEASEYRDEEFELFDLARSFADHARIPVGFEGNFPEVFERPGADRFAIGNSYKIPTNDGSSVTGQLIDGTVDVPNKQFMGVFLTDNERQIIARAPLSDEEVKAYEGSPETFLGVVRGVGRNVDDPVDLYRFFLDSYAESTKEKLLEFMNSHPDIHRLQGLERGQLAKLYSERMALAVLARRERRG